MRPEERLEIARLAYRHAVALARAGSTPASWRRVLAAARNVRAAVLDRDRRGGAARTAGAGRTTAAAPTRCAPPARPNRASPAAAAHRGAASAPAATAQLWLDVIVELERARVLTEESRRLVRDARWHGEWVAAAFAGSPR